MAEKFQTKGFGSLLIYDGNVEFKTKMLALFLLKSTHGEIEIQKGKYDKRNGSSKNKE
jgi:hypothetical protein